MTHAAQLLWGVISVLAGAGDGGGPATSLGSEEPLLVIVERGHGATTSPEQVRHAISEELHRPVVGPADAAGKNASQMLVVTIAADSVAMQMRSAGDLAARRRIEPLVSGESSLRVVAWLAGNLARDQAGELMDALPGAAFATGETAHDASPAAAPLEAVPSFVPAETLAQPAAVATPPEQVQAPWRLGLAIGSYTRIWDDSSYSVTFDRFEIMTPSREGHWSSTIALEVASPAQADRSVVLLGGANRRFTLIPHWLATDVGAAVGLVISRFTEQRSPFVAASGGGGLAFVGLPFGELVADARATSILDRYFAFSIGFNVALQ